MHSPAHRRVGKQNTVLPFRIFTRENISRRPRGSVGQATGVARAAALKIMP